MRAARGEIAEKPLWRQMLVFFLPILFGTFFQQLYNTADAVIVGRFVGKEALASVGGSSGSIINLLVGFFVGLSNGVTVIIAQSYGARNKETIRLAVHTGMALALAGGAVLTVFGIAAAGAALRWMGTPEDVFASSRIYLIICFAGMIPNLVYNIGSGVLRAVGDSRRPLYFLIATCIVNIVLDIAFVAGLRMGVAGAALATVLSQTVSAVLVLLVLTRTHDVYRLNLREIHFHGPMLRRTIQIGVPSGIQSAMYSISNLLIQASVNSFGTDTMAAWTAFQKIDALNWMGSGAFGIAVSTFAGQSYGAGDYARMKKTVRCGAVMDGIYAGSLSLLMVFGGRYALHLFLGDGAVIAYGVTMIRFIASGYVLFVPIELLSAVCRSAGDTLRPTAMTAAGICGLRVVWLFTVLAHWHYREVLFACYPISWIVTSALFIAYYFRGNWLHVIPKAAAVKEGA